MLVCLATTEYDLRGHVAIEASSTSLLGDTSRRVNRVQTLDGGVVFNDFGHAHGDRTIQLRWQPASQDETENLARLVRDYQQLVACVPGGAFLVVPQTYTPGQAESQISLLVARKLST